MLAACPFPANHGTPGSIREMAEAVCSVGHEVHIVTYHFGEDIVVRGPRLHRITPLTNEESVVVGPTSRRPLYDLQMVFKTLQVIRDHRPHLLHAHGYEAALAAWLCRLATGLPMVYSGHNTMADELPTYRFIRPQFLAQALARALDVLVPRLGDLCLPHSANIQQFFHHMGLRGRTEKIVNFGIDVDWIARGDCANLRQRHGLGGEPVVLYTGVLDEFQRIDLLLGAMTHVLKAEPTARLLVVVSIPQEKHLSRIRREAGNLGILDHIIFTDPQRLESVRNYLQVADVAVVPRPQAPGFPIKLLNYMAASRPCALFTSSASTGLVHRQNCLLASPDSAEALAGAILELIGDPALAQRLGCNAYTFVGEQHDRLAIARKVCATYYRVLERTGRLDALRHLHPMRPAPGPLTEPPAEGKDVVARNGDAPYAGVPLQGVAYSGV